MDEFGYGLRKLQTTDQEHLRYIVRKVPSSVPPPRTGIDFNGDYSEHEGVKADVASPPEVNAEGSAHVDTNSLKQVVQLGDGNATDLAMAYSSQVRTSRTLVHFEAGTLRYVTFFSCVALVVVCLSLLTHAPHWIRTLLQSRHAAIVVMTRSDDPVQISNAVVFWGIMNVLVSMSLIKYNKWLMTPGRFPFATNLTLCHQCSGSLFMFVMYSIKPKLFPSMDGFARGETLSQSTLLAGLLLVALCFSGQLVLSNSAYVYASVTFCR
jgi:hypothetical protein